MDAEPLHRVSSHLRVAALSLSNSYGKICVNQMRYKYNTSRPLGADMHLDKDAHIRTELCRI